MYMYWIWDIHDYVMFWKWQFICLLFICVFILGIMRVSRNIKVVGIDKELHKALIELANKNS